jgi:2-polyprenyl-3-methyl-5-hydroxy-6-metoxy-1,4-benzoquinol methylase
MRASREGRRLTDPVPEWEEQYVRRKVEGVKRPLPARAFGALETLLDEWTHPCPLRSTAELLGCVDLLLDADRLGKRAAVIGCGPQPERVRDLAVAGYRVVGVEPVAEGVRLAREYLAGAAEVVQGTAERMALESRSQSVVLLENVLEHVDSVSQTLQEACRVLQPGGVLFVRTTNRQRCSLTGVTWEFSTRFFNWLPRLVRESYVFDQLHHRPELAQFSPRPAVHWFSFADLCASGREAGFARFYSPHDLLHLARRPQRGWRGSVSRWSHRQPWLRALAISQLTGDIFMWKRPEPGEIRGGAGPEPDLRRRGA